MLMLAPPPGYATLVELARCRARDLPSRKAYTFLRSGDAPAAHLTFGELDVQARRIAARLQQHFEPGDRVLLAYASGCEFIPAFFGCLYAGVVPVLTPSPTGTNDVARLKRAADESGAAGLCTGSVGFNVRHLGLCMPSLRERLCCLEVTADDAHTPAPQAWVDPGIDPHDTAFLQYTSGATGAPKPVRVSHANVVHNQRLIEAAFGGNARTRALSWLPPDQDMGLVGHVVQPLHLGVTSVLMSPAAFVASPARWLQAISDHRATISGGPNVAYELCIRRVTGEQMRSLDLRSWEVAYNGAERVRAETLERFAEKFAACGFRREAFVACYGMAEATLFASASRRAAFPPVCTASGDVSPTPAGRRARHARTLVSCGPASAWQLRVVNPDTRLPCPPGEVGEVWLRGDGVTSGYWNQPDATRANYGARLADSGEGRYLRTGDLGFVDAGELYITGRLHDLVRLGGRDYDPGEIEDAVRASHPALRDGGAAAFSVDAPGVGRLIVLHELQRGQSRRLPHADVQRAARSAVRARFGVHLQQMVLLPAGSLPRTIGGYVRRLAAREAYLTRALAPAVSARR